MGVKQEEPIREESFCCGDYLGNFAQSLVGRGYGKRAECERSDTYSFNHRNLDKLEVVVSHDWLGIGNAQTYDVVLRGPRKQIKEFMRVAGKELDDGKHSKDSVDKQLSRSKEYDGVLKKVDFGQARASIGNPVVFANVPWGAGTPTWVQIGYLEELGRDSLWIVRCFCLSSLGQMSGKGKVIHKVEGVKYVGGGHEPSGSTILFEDCHARYYLVEAEDFDEILERIEDSRPVVIT